jgi:2-phospho-L-lactate/phosphoenolpyruvate guanylyltransferase
LKKMRALLLPVKDLRNAKQRLASTLSPSERARLAEAMLSDTIRAVNGVREADAIFVATNYEPVIQLAKMKNWEILREEEQISESVSVDAASGHCEERGFSAVLRIPLDIPLVRAGDIDDLLSINYESPAVVIVPSRDGTGTNAMLRTPPTLFPSRFGNGSFARHCAEAKSVSAQVIVRRNPRLEMDVDDESDLRALLQHDLSGTETGEWLARSGLLAHFHDVPGHRVAAR